MNPKVSKKQKDNVKRIQSLFLKEILWLFGAWLLVFEGLGLAVLGLGFCFASGNTDTCLSTTTILSYGNVNAKRNISRPNYDEMRDMSKQTPKHVSKQWKRSSKCNKMLNTYKS